MIGVSTGSPVCSLEDLRAGAPADVLAEPGRGSQYDCGPIRYALRPAMTIVAALEEVWLPRKTASRPQRVRVEDEDARQSGPVPERLAERAEEHAAGSCPGRRVDPERGRVALEERLARLARSEPRRLGDLVGGIGRDRLAAVDRPDDPLRHRVFALILRFARLRRAGLRPSSLPPAQPSTARTLTS